MTAPMVFRSLKNLAVALIIVLGLTRAVTGHPHVFVDGSVDFVFDDRGVLTAVDVTWRYDMFETLYILSTLDLVPGADGSLSPEEKKKLIENESQWPDGFEGATHLSIGGVDQRLSGPNAVEVDNLDNRLVVRFRRHLHEPAEIDGLPVEIAFYETTYYYAFSLIEVPKLKNGPETCAVRTIPFDPDTGLVSLQASLASLGREETPTIANVGVLFADRAELNC